MANEKMSLIGKKLGMIQIFDEDGRVHPVTVIQAAPNTVLQVKTTDGPDGYNAVQLGFDEVDDKHTTKPEKGHFDKAGAAPQRYVREMRLDGDSVSTFEPGQQIGVTDVFEDGELCDVTGISKGKGFQGVVKRHGFSGFERTHGTHEYFRHGGAIGTRLTPGHVLKGKRMGGQMGNKRVTIQNLEIKRLDDERGLVFVEGGVPGSTGSMVVIRKAAKKG